MDQQIKQWRAETPGIKHRIHFNNAGAALAPQSVIAIQKAYLEEEALLGGYELAAKYKKDIQQTYVLIAQLLNARADQVALTTNATDSYNKALSSIPFKKGELILTSKNDYVSNHIAFMQLQKFFGVKIVLANNTTEGIIDVDHVAALIKKEKPKLVAITHIPTSSGYIQDVNAIGELCEAQDIWYLVDACQSVGQLNIDVQKIKCDFLSATGRKFLRGPRGTGFLYVSDKVLKRGLEPLFLDLHSASWPATDQYEVHPGALRFELWEKNYGLILGLKAAVEYALTLDMEFIQSRIQSLAQEVRNKLAKIEGICIQEKGKNLAGIVTAKVDNWQAEAFKKALFDKKINTSLIFKEGARFDLGKEKIDWVSRISVHYYNTLEEIEQLEKVLKRDYLGHY